MPRRTATVGLRHVVDDGRRWLGPRPRIGRVVLVAAFGIAVTAGACSEATTTPAGPTSSTGSSSTNVFNLTPSLSDGSTPPDEAVRVICNLDADTVRANLQVTAPGGQLDNTRLLRERDADDFAVIQKHCPDQVGIWRAAGADTLPPPKPFCAPGQMSSKAHICNQG